MKAHTITTPTPQEAWSIVAVIQEGSTIDHPHGKIEITKNDDGTWTVTEHVEEVTR